MHPAVASLRFGQLVDAAVAAGGRGVRGTACTAATESKVALLEPLTDNQLRCALRLAASDLRPFMRSPEARTVRKPFCRSITPTAMIKPFAQLRWNQANERRIKQFFETN